MSPLVKMLIALVSIITMFLANLFIMFARNKLTGAWKVTVSTIAFLLLILSFIFIIIVVFSV